MILRLLAGGLCALILGLPSVAVAQGRPIAIAPNLRVSFVGYTSGRLVIIGNTLPNVLVTLEQTFHLRANAAGDFTYTLLYVVQDCIVDISTQYGLGRALVAGCGPKGATGAVGPRGLTGLTGAQGPAGPAGVSPQGEWESEGSYQENDLVFHGGSTWRATDQEELYEPGSEESGWELFAQGGEDGEDGVGGAGNAMFAVVAGDGTWVRGYPDGAGYISQKVELATGTYEVIFGDNDITGCAYVADVGSTVHSGTQDPGFVTVVGRAGNSAGVFVQVFDTGGSLVDYPFHLAVTCPPVGQ
jgi:hypothetical protein